MPKIAAIDAGSNAIRMVVGELDDKWNVSPIENIRLPVRLGEDVFSKGHLEEKTIRQAEEAFLHFKRVAENYDVQYLQAVATSAAREANNSAVLLDRIASASGIQLKLISGEEEARLIHQAVVHALDLRNKRTLLIDIGGGSVEVTTSNGRNIISTDSYNLGTVRLLEKLDGEGLTPETFSKLVQEYAEAARYRIEKDIGRGKIQVCVGTGGNVEEIGRLGQKLFKGESDRLITLEELKELIRRLSSLSYKDRVQKWKLRPDRADVILPASIVLYTISWEAGARQILIPSVGLKDGILLEIAEELSHRPQLQRKVQAWHSALHLGRKYKFDERHAQLTARLACRLFEQARSLHHLSDEYLLSLEIASLLHDIGIFINAVGHEKHGFYILTVNRLIGLTDREQNIVANLVRYHRKDLPSTGDENYKCLSRQDRDAVTKLSALLRLADSSDIGRDHLVSDVNLSKNGTGWHIHVSGRPDMMLANWAIGKRKQLFEQVFGVSLQIH